MRVDRRALIVGGAMLAVAPSRVLADAPVLALLDPSLLEGAILPPGRRVILRGDPVRALHGAGPLPGRVAGITGWGDYVLLRSLLREDGMRVREEHVVRRPGGAARVEWLAVR